MKNLRITVNSKSYDVQVEEIGASNESSLTNDSIDFCISKSKRINWDCLLS